jgi:hypothetical protein
MSRSLAELREYLVGEWLFQNDFRDTSGNGNHGVPTDIEWKPTARGLKPYLNDSSKITIPDFSFNCDNNFTISFWVINNVIRPENYGGCSYFLSKENRYMNYFANDDDGRIRVESGTNNNYVFFSSTGHYLNNSTSHIVLVVNNGLSKCYVNGTEIEAINNSCAGLEFNLNTIGMTTSDTSPICYIDDIKFYKGVSFTDVEVLALYNSTKNAVGVRPAERSFTHRLSPEVDENTVFATDMRTKNADGTLIDLSGNSNHGQPTGCVRSGGYFTDGMRFQSDYVEVLASDSINVNDGSSWSAEIFLGDYTSGDLNTLFSCGRNYGTSEAIGWAIGYHAGSLHFDINTDVDRFDNYIDTQVADSHILCIYDSINAESHVYINGVHQRTLATSGDIVSINNLVIGAQSNYDRRPSNMNVRFAALHKDIVDPTSRFNSLAALPLYEFDFAKYPSNTTVYSAGESLPYSTARVESGSFKVDNGKLQCVTSGQMKLRNAHEFDGDEYIKLTIDDTVYAGTGTITQGTTTASIEQGSTLITVDMVAGDTIDSIDIQFREPVDE